MRIRLLLFVTLLFLASCTAAPPVANNNASPEPSTAAATPQSSPLTDFERTLQFVKNGGYTYVWVFTRKDGKPFDKDDSAFLQTNAPQLVDRALTKDQKKVIAGTNFNLEEGGLAELKKKYVAEDYSAK